MRWEVTLAQSHLKKLFAYRVDFWVETLVGAAAYAAFSWYFWKSVMSHHDVQTLAGFSGGDIIYYSVFAGLVEKTIRGPVMHFISDDIYQGTLSKFLVYPLSIQRYKFIEFFCQSFVIAIQMSLIVFAFAFFSHEDLPLTHEGWRIFLFVVALFTGMLCFFYVQGCIEILAFWQDNIWTLSVMCQLVVAALGGGFFPLDFFPETLATFLKYLPFAGMISTPVLTVMGKITAFEASRSLVVTWVWLIALHFLFKILWKRGLKNYSGVGM